MDNSYNTQNRKKDHIRINLEEEVNSKLSNGFENYFFIHNALPELDLDQIQTSTLLFDKLLSLPLLISSMTGGTDQSEKINHNLALSAQTRRIAMGLGSMRAMLEARSQTRSFQVRKIAPDILLLANLGAVQLNYGVSLDDCRRLVDTVEADGLILHLNSLQEALQPEGQTNFSGLLAKIEGICAGISVPVIIKEVGWGISASTARRLIDAGVSAIDVAGAGGTSWSQVEMFRSANETDKQISSHFRDWGMPTAESLRVVKMEAGNLPLFASGGLTNGVELAKAIAMGAAVGGMAGRFLKAAVISPEEVIKVIDEIQKELKIVMFAVGAENIAALSTTPLVKRNLA